MQRGLSDSPEAIPKPIPSGSSPNSETSGPGYRARLKHPLLAQGAPSTGTPIKRAQSMDLPDTSANESKHSAAYACPICGTETKNLLHLNHHLDKVHAIATTPEDDDDPGKLIFNWFKKTGENAQRVLNQTGENLGLKKGVSIDALNQLTGAVGVTSFNASASASALGSETFVSTTGANMLSVNAIPRDGGAFDLNPNDDLPFNNPDLCAKLGIDAIAAASLDEATIAAAANFITRKHWQKENEMNSMSCNSPQCDKVLISSGVKMGKMVVGAAGVGNVSAHCRKCGKIFCEEHVSWQMRLNVKDAKHDTVGGLWCRVCYTCFSGRDGYTDSNGVTRNRTASFLMFRKNMSDVVSLEINKLESRYEKLSALYAEIPISPRSKARTLSSLTSSLTLSPGTSNRRDFDQSVVTWQDDSEVSSCPICSSSFSTLFNPLNRRHHCRLCGRVVCGLETCSSNVALTPKGTTVQPQDLELSQESDTKARNHEVKVCSECKKLVFRRKTGQLEKLRKPQVVLLYEDYLKTKSEVQSLLPKFNNLIMTLSGQPSVKMDDRAYILASKHRKTLMDLFAKIESAGKRIKSLPTSSVGEQRLQDSIQIALIQYLQGNMFTLTLMPKVTQQKPMSLGNVTSIAFSDLQRLDAASKTLDVMEGQEAALRAQMEEAIRKRRLEDAGALREALDEVEAEVVRLKEEIRVLKGV
ncbi:FYVE zinc finger-domain-containing protein [Chytriomyces cf. hyalinus JEL632]|nr:FYVE zinc finger-domain-containing protein [Chytriomyces cf. hyalinus JEL632]